MIDSDLDDDLVTDADYAEPNEEGARELLQESLRSETGVPDVYDMTLLHNVKEDLNLTDYSVAKKSIHKFDESPFVELLVGGKRTVLKKTSFCWLLNSGNERVSTDRLKRFISQSNTDDDVSLPCRQVKVRDKLWIGNWCIFENKCTKTRNKSLTMKVGTNSFLNDYILGRVLAFSYLTGKCKQRHYSLEHAPTSVECFAGAKKGLGCLCTWYVIENNGKLTLTIRPHEFYNIEFYKFSVPSPDVNEEDGQISLALNERTVDEIQSLLTKETLHAPPNKSETNCSTDTGSEASSQASYKSDVSSEDCDSSDNDSNDAIVNITLQNYYAVYYDTSWYIERVLNIIGKNKFRIKFLKEKLGEFEWPRTGDVQVVERLYVFYGPVILCGAGPFKVNDEDRRNIASNYKQLKKNFQKN